MIFASDLDRTLIYSNRFVPDFDGQVKVVESGKYTSFMTERAAKLLRDISTRVTFVPCTTRTIEQYRRIRFFQQECVPVYAVVSNGGNLITEGVIDREYRINMERKLENSCLPASDLLKEFDQFVCGGWVDPLREADGLFYYCLIDRTKLPASEIDGFGVWAHKQNWEMSLQGRKLYLVPKVINKWTALAKIKELTGESKVFAAGDSLLDLPMIIGADYAICPAHGEIFDNFNRAGGSGLGKFKVDSTEASGITAAEEILERVLNLVWRNSSNGTSASS